MVHYFGHQVDKLKCQPLPIPLVHCKKKKQKKIPLYLIHYLFFTKTFMNKQGKRCNEYKEEQKKMEEKQGSRKIMAEKNGMTCR